MKFVSIFAIMLSTAPLAHAADDPAAERARKELEPRPVNITNDALPLDQALKLLEGQTGNSVVDRRRPPHNSNPKLRLDLKQTTFWPALDEITRQAGCGFSVYQEDGKLALVEAPQRRMQVVYSGICRLAIKRVSVARDDDTGTSFGNVVLEIAWEPRFQPFFLHGGPGETILGGNGFGRKPIRLPESGEIHVAGRGAAEVDLRITPAPPRSCPSLASLSGKFTLMGPSKMLTFRFANWKAGQPMKQTQEDVQVSLTPQPLRPGHWPFDVVIDNPPGGPTFESHKADKWLVNNEIYLEKGNAVKITPLASSVQELGNIDARHAAMRWVFTRDLPAQPAGWSVVYRTPARIVELPLTFAFKDVPLP